MNRPNVQRRIATELWQLVATILLIVTTLHLSESIPRYQVTNSAGESGLAVKTGRDAWNISLTGNVSFSVAENSIKIESQRRETTVTASQLLNRVIAPDEVVQLKAKIKVANVSTGQKSWEAARVILVGMDENGTPMYQVPHVLAALNGTSDWMEYSGYLHGVAGAVNQRLEIQLAGVTGVAWVKDIRLQSVKPTDRYQRFSQFFLLMWLGLCLWVFLTALPYIRSSANVKWLPLLACLTLAGTLMPAEIKHQIGAVFDLYLPWMGGEEAIYKVGHFISFFLLACAFFVQAPSKEAIVRRMWCLAYLALATESLQLFVMGRTFRWSDIAIDLAGVSAGLFLVVALLQSGVLHSQAEMKLVRQKPC